MKISQASKLNRFFSGPVLLALLLLFLASGCANRQASRHDPGVAIYAPEKPAAKCLKKDATYPIDAYDPWECFNRDMYLFNYYFDRYIYLPVVHAYEWVMPDFLEERVSGIFKNFSELGNLSNNILQGKPEGTAVTGFRILMNTTLGLGGMFDVATGAGLPAHKEDFGQTLGVYGVGPGPYMVLPVLGPSSLRDTTGLAVDGIVRTLALNGATRDMTHKETVRTTVNVTEAIDKRHQIKFRYYQSGSPFEYEFVRKLYLEHRKIEVAK